MMANGEETPREFVRRKRQEARASLEEFSPQARSIARLVVGLSTAKAKEFAKYVQAFVENADYTGEEWLRDGVALTIGHWSNPAAMLGGLFLDKSAPEEPEPSKFLHFNLDQSSEATDPVPIAVNSAMLKQIKQGKVRALELTGESQKIPEGNIRFSVGHYKGSERAYVSLVGLGPLKLKKGRIGGPVRVVPTGRPKGSVSPVTIGAVTVRIDPAPEQ
jgi:hypothetical protein